MINTKKEIESGKNQGIYETIELIPKTSKRDETLSEINEALSKNGNKFYVFRKGFTLNSVYEYIKELKEKYSLEVSWGKTKTGTETIEGKQKDIIQFVLFKKKETKQ